MIFLRCIIIILTIVLLFCAAYKIHPVNKISKYFAQQFHFNNLIDIWSYIKAI